MTEFAFRFEPFNGGKVVPAGAFASAISAAAEALQRVLHTAAPGLATERRLPVSQVRSLLTVGIVSVKPGSIVVGVAFGVDGTLPLHHRAIVDEGVLRAQQTIEQSLFAPASGDLPSTAARAFAQAAHVAKTEGNSRFAFVAREVGKRTTWRTRINMTELEPRFRRFVKRSETSKPSTTQLIGQITALHLDPLGFTLMMKDSSTRVSILSPLREAARKNWGRDVIVDVEGALRADGTFGDARARDIKPLRPVKLRAFEKTFGLMRKDWNTAEAKKYFDE